MAVRLGAKREPRSGPPLSRSESILSGHQVVPMRIGYDGRAPVA